MGHGGLERWWSEVGGRVLSAEALARGRDLVAGDGRLGAELQGLSAELFAADPQADADALMWLLGAGPGLPIGLALAAEAGEIDISGAFGGSDQGLRAEGRDARRASPSLRDLGEALRAEAGEIDLSELFGPSRLAEALAAEAGEIDISGAFGSSELDAALRAEAGEIDISGAFGSSELNAALLAEAGEIDISGAFGSSELNAALRAEAGEIDLSDLFGPSRLEAALRSEAGEIDLSDLFGPSRLEAALRSEAGEIDISEAFGEGALAKALASEAGRVDVSREVLEALRPASVVVDHDELPVANPSNRAFLAALVAMAAMLLVTVWAGVSGLVGPTEQAPGAPLQFASAGEITIEDLSYAGDVHVFEAVGNEGAVILWFDEGAAL